jgi:hypothetical protein
MERHVKVCEHRIVPCEWCKKEDIVAATAVHALKCNLRLAECEHCHSSVKARELASHLNGRCTVSPTGDVHCFCSVTVKRRDEEAHLRESLGRQLRVQQEQMAAQERRMRAEMEGHFEELQELRRTVSMAATTTLLWKVTMQVNASLVQKSAAFFFSGISLYFECKWWAWSDNCSLSVRPVARGGPFVVAGFSAAPWVVKVEKAANAT